MLLAGWILLLGLWFGAFGRFRFNVFGTIFNNLFVGWLDRPFEREEIIFSLVSVASVGLLLLFVTFLVLLTACGASLLVRRLWDIGLSLGLARLLIATLILFAWLGWITPLMRLVFVVAFIVIGFIPSQMLSPASRLHFR